MELKEKECNGKPLLNRESNGKVFIVDENESLTETTDSSDSDADPLARGNWDNKMEFILCLVGYSVGLGNLWRFPYLCVRNGGGAFLLPFFILLFLAGIPLYFLEVALGQFCGISPLFVWEMCPLFRGLGWLMVMVSGICSFYYIILLAWSIFYFGNSFFPTLPWTSCDNDWNTAGCMTPQEQMFGSANETNVTRLMRSEFNRSSAEQFWQRRLLHASAGLEDLGQLEWHMVLSLLAGWFLIFVCLIKGVKSLGKVVYVTALLPYLLLTILLIKGLTLPGASDGILFYLKPDFTHLARFQVWTEAGIQVFFSLGPAWGGLITMASFNKFHNNCLRDSIIGALADGFTSTYGGLVIFSVLGFIAHETGLPIESFSKSGPGLAFVVYPSAIATLPIPQLWACVFFLNLILVGIDSQFGMFEGLCAAVVDSFPSLIPRKTLVTFVICAVMCCGGLILATSGGVFVFTLIDWYVAAFAVTFGALVESIVIGWIYGAKRFSGDIQMMLGRPPPTFIRISWCILSPVVLFAILVLAIVGYAPPEYKGYTFPPWAIVIGFIIAISSILPIPICAGLEILKRKGSFSQRLKDSMQPSEKWGPANEKYKSIYKSYRVRSVGATVWKRAVDNMVGKPDFL